MSVISFQAVSWRKGPQTILEDIDWQVETGQHWAVIGRNGSGKTSILRMINGYNWPSTGTIEVLNQRFGSCDLRELRKSIGLVSSSFQEQLQTAHPGESALEVALSGKFASLGIYDEFTQDDVAKACSLLDQFGCMPYADRPFSSLSQGEKQRVLLARAWMAQPKLLILDEPCTGLDVPAREQLLEAVDVMANSPDAPTLLFVTHHIEELLPAFTHALLLKSGRVLAQGVKRDVLTDEWLTEAFTVPVQVSWHEDRPWLRVSSASQPQSR